MSRTEQPDHLFCPHCATKNPRKAYCCLKCFKVMFPAQKLGFLRANIPSSVSITVIFAALVLAGLYAAQKWLSTIEANMSLIIRTTEYNVAVTADKKKNEPLNQDLALEKTSPK